MRDPPDIARVPAPVETGTPTPSDATSKCDQGNTGVSAPAAIVKRCAAREPCCEVRDRLVAADRSELEGFVEVAAQLRTTASRFAEAHGYGQAVGHEGA